MLNQSLLVSSAACGVMAGIYFAFSVFIMKAFASMPGPSGAVAMRAINDVILKTAFMPLFFLSTALCAVLSIFAAFNWEDRGSGIILSAALLYVVGMFVVTAAFNVPLNNKLAALNMQTIDVEITWKSYVQIWTNYNHIRAVSSLGACLLFAYAYKTI
ncbi:MAG: DUF1772 domain-containing protein [Sphingopyxis sp.]|nr:DUF1772 domain-containing protein [Sphingopyxis sp.]